MFVLIFLPQVSLSTLSSFLLKYRYTMILQRIRIIVGHVGFEPGTSAPEVWCATNEPPHFIEHPLGPQKKKLN